MTNTGTIHLQSIGARPAITAAELKVGDVRIYNAPEARRLLAIIDEAASR